MDSKDSSYYELKKQKEGLIHISYSEFTKYQECGHRHLIEKYLEIVPPTTSIHLIFGNSIHSSIEMGLKENWQLERRIEHFREMFYTNMMNELKDSPEFRQVNEFMEQGINIIALVNTTKLLEKYELVGVETALYENLFSNYHFKGFIDLIVKDRKTGRIIIIDWKTSGEPWDVQKKKKDKIFMAQMRFYKYFYGRKFNVSLDQIDCKYVVLNRLKSKKLPDLGFGDLQPVEIFSDLEEIESSLKLLSESIRDIHIRNYFPKAKLNGKTSNCFFCPFKNDPTMCNSNPTQYMDFLEQYKHKRAEKSLLTN
jgi:hypothetical protein